MSDEKNTVIDAIEIANRIATSTVEHTEIEAIMARYILRVRAIVEAAEAQEMAHAAVVKAVEDRYRAGDGDDWRAEPEHTNYERAQTATEQAVRALDAGKTP